MDVSLQTSKALQEIIDHHEIRKVLSVYCHGCDRGDETRIASAYLEDSMDFHGDYKGPGGIPFAKRVVNSVANGVKNTHLLGQSLINVEGDEAGADTYFIANVTTKGPGGGDVANFMGGRYVDTFRREDGHWKISRRIVVRDWSISLDVKNDWLENKDFARGQIMDKDPSYAVLGLTLRGFTAA